MAPNWSFLRWVSESRSFMRHTPAWKFYPLAVWKWPAFDRKQRKDARESGI